MFVKAYNLITIAVTIFIIFNLQQKISQNSKQQTDTLRLVNAIALGQSLTSQDRSLIYSLISNYTSLPNTPLCFLKAYAEVVLQQNLQPFDVFKIFEGNNQEYDGVQNCSQYFQVLLYRAENIQKEQKIAEVLQNLRRQSLGIKEKDQISQKNKICIYVQAWNSQSSIRQQIQHLLADRYQEYIAVIQADGSSDNTHILAKHVIDEQVKNKNILIHRNAERKGLVQSLAVFLKQHCHEDDLVVVLSGKQKLIGQSTLQFINQLFQQDIIQMVYFQTISNYSNFVGASLNGPTPVFAATYKLIAPLLPKLKQISTTLKKPELERQLIFRYLLQKSQARAIKSAVSFGGQTFNFQQVEALENVMESTKQA